MAVMSEPFGCEQKQMAVLYYNIDADSTKTLV